MTNKFSSLRKLYFLANLQLPGGKNRVIEERNDLIE
jgi:hypothetical protein